LQKLRRLRHLNEKRTWEQQGRSLSGAGKERRGPATKKLGIWTTEKKETSIEGAEPLVDGESYKKIGYRGGGTSRRRRFSRGCKGQRQKISKMNSRTNSTERLGGKPRGRPWREENRATPKSAPKTPGVEKREGREEGGLAPMT